MTCPIGKPSDDCPCEAYAKEGICDYPYRNDLPPENMTQILAILAEMEAGNGF